MRTLKILVAIVLTPLYVVFDFVMILMGGPCSIPSVAEANRMRTPVLWEWAISNGSFPLPIVLD